MKTGIVWLEGLAYTMGEGDSNEKVYHYCTTDYNNMHITIIPTNVIAGNKHYGDKDVETYIFTMSLIDGICIGYSSREYSSIKEAQSEARKLADMCKRSTVKEDSNA